MKIVIINGSPRKGNTVAAIDAFIEGASGANEIEVICADKLDISPCKGCGACGCTKGCVAKDDTNPTIDKIAAADMVVYASPVYWWGITAQAKLVMDKCYCRGALMKGKKMGAIIVGGASLEDVEYELIKSQFECISKYLGCEMVFHESFAANALGELAKNDAAMEKMKALGRSL